MMARSPPIANHPSSYPSSIHRFASSAQTGHQRTNGQRHFHRVPASTSHRTTTIARSIAARTRNMCLITSNKGARDVPPPRPRVYREQGSGVFFSEPAPIAPRRSYASSRSGGARSRSSGARSRSSVRDVREVREVREITYPPSSPRASYISNHSLRNAQPVVVLPAGTRTVRAYR